MSVSRVAIDLTGLHKLQRVHRTRAEQIVGTGAHNVEAGAKRNIVAKHIIDTGALLNGMRAHRRGMFEWVVADSVNYGIHHEFGTSRMAARPFLAPAVEAERPRLLSAWRGLLK